MRYLETKDCRTKAKIVRIGMIEDEIATTITLEAKKTLTIPDFDEREVRYFETKDCRTVRFSIFPSIEAKIERIATIDDEIATTVALEAKKTVSEDRRVT